MLTHNSKSVNVCIAVKYCISTLYYAIQCVTTIVRSRPISLVLWKFCFVLFLFSSALIFWTQGVYKG